MKERLMLEIFTNLKFIIIAVQRDELEAKKK